MTLHADKDNAVISRERVTDKTYSQQIAPAKEKEEPDDAARFLGINPAYGRLLHNTYILDTLSRASLISLRARGPSGYIGRMANIETLKASKVADIVG